MGLGLGLGEGLRVGQKANHFSQLPSGNQIKLEVIFNWKFS